MSDDPILFPRGNKDELELGERLQPKFDADGLIPCITVDATTNEVLMFAYMNERSLLETIHTGNATFWSRSRAELWTKGKESGNFLRVREVRTDCDQDVILLKVELQPDGAACHNGYRSCFYRKLGAHHRLEMAGGPRKFDPALVYKKKS